MRELICGSCLNEGEREQRMRADLGLAPAESANAIHQDGDAATTEGGTPLQTKLAHTNENGTSCPAPE